MKFINEEMFWGNKSNKGYIDLDIQHDREEENTINISLVEFINELKNGNIQMITLMYTFPEEAVPDRLRKIYDYIVINRDYIYFEIQEKIVERLIDNLNNYVNLFSGTGRIEYYGGCLKVMYIVAYMATGVNIFREISNKTCNRDFIDDLLELTDSNDNVISNDNELDLLLNVTKNKLVPLTIANTKHIKYTTVDKSYISELEELINEVCK